MTESEVSDRYQSYSTDEFIEEVPVGDVLVEKYQYDVPIRDDRRLTLRADLHTPSDDTLQLVECKQELNITALGQILTYTRFYDHDRETLRTHLNQTDELISTPATGLHLTDDTTQRVREPIQNLNLSIAVESLPGAQEALVRSCTSHGVSIELVETGVHNISKAVTGPETTLPISHPTTVSVDMFTECLERRSHTAMQPSSERRLLSALPIDRESISVYREVPLTGSHENNQDGVRADAIIVYEDAPHVMAVELKSIAHTSKGPRAYYKGIGQALTAAALIEREFGIAAEPVLIVDELPILAKYLTPSRPSSLPWEELFPTTVEVQPISQGAHSQGVADG